jgi:hypothetical protein
MTTGNGWKSIAQIARDDSLTGELFDAEDAILVRAPGGEGPPTDEVRDRDPAISVARAESRRLRARAKATAALGRLRVRRGEDERKRVDLGRVVPQNKERHGRRGWHGRTESSSVCVCCCCLSSLSFVDVMVRGRRLSSSSASSRRGRRRRRRRRRSESPHCVRSPFGPQMSSALRVSPPCRPSPRRPPSLSHPIPSF